MKPKAAEVHAPVPAPVTPPVYIDVLVNNDRRRPTERKVVRAKLLARYPCSVLVELPDGSVVKRRLGRDVPSLVPHIGRT
jgi:hypothetical protein